MPRLHPEASVRLYFYKKCRIQRHNHVTHRVFHRDAHTDSGSHRFLFDLYTADEVIVSGTAAELCAIVKIDGRTIGAGVPGPVYKKLLADFQEETKIGDAY